MTQATPASLPLAKLLFGTLLLAASLPGTAQAAAAAGSAPADAPLLFELRPSAPLAKRALPRFVLRQSPLAFKRGLQELPGLDAVTLDLFGRKTVAARVRSRRPSASHVEWVGRLPDDPDGSVLLVEREGMVVGKVETREGIFEIRSEPGAGASLHEVDVAALAAGDRGCQAPPGKPAPLSIPLSEPAPTPAPAAKASAAGSAAAPVVLDLIIVYDQAVLNKRPDAVALFHALVAEANEAYARSRIEQTLRLVHTVKLEKGWRALDPKNYDSLWKDTEINNLRYRYGADLVAAIVSEPSQVSNGYGYLEYPYSMSALEPAATLRTLTHELGHNMGAEHNREALSTPPATGFSYGFRNLERKFITVMGTFPTCAGCVRINNFSNPSVLHDGTPTGVADWADNARKLRENAAKVAAFMPSTWGLSVAKTGQGRVTSDAAGIDCGSDCAQDYARIDFRKVTLTAAAAPGFRFQGWGGACAGSAAATCAVVLDANRRVEARFEPDPDFLVLSLHDVKARRDVAVLTETSVLRIDTLPEALTVQARLKSAVGSVKFDLTGPTFHSFVAAAAPYALYGSVGGQPLAWTRALRGRFNLAVAAHAGPNAGGEVLASRFLVLDFQAPPTGLDARAPLVAGVRSLPGGVRFELAHPARLEVVLRGLDGRTLLRESADHPAGTRTLSWPEGAGAAPGIHVLGIAGPGRTLYRGLVRIP